MQPPEDILAESGLVRGEDVDVQLAKHGFKPGPLRRVRQMETGFADHRLARAKSLQGETAELLDGQVVPAIPGIAQRDQRASIQDDHARRLRTRRTAARAARPS